MKFLQHILTASLVLLAAAVTVIPAAFPSEALAATTSVTQSALPIVVRDGKEYYSYEVKKGDSLYGLSRTHGWDEALLLETNPQVASGLKRGVTIYYPVQDVAEGQYRVKSGDTVYALATTFGVTVDDMYAANPESRHGIFEGQILTIPRPKNVEAPLQAANTQTTAGQPVANQATPTQAETKQSVANQPVATQPTETPDTVAVAPVDQVLDIALLLDSPKSNRDLEFTRGFLLALDNMKHSGRKISLNVLSVNDSIPYGNEALLNADVIVTTSDKNLPQTLADYAESRGARLVNVFDVKSELYYDNLSVVNLMTPTSYFNTGVAQWLADQYSDCQLFLLGDPDEGDTMAQEIVATFPIPAMDITFEDFEDMTFQDGDKVLVYCTSTKKADVTRSLELLASKVQENPLAYIASVGRPNWVVYVEDLAGKMADASVMIPSRFYFDEVSPEGKRFIRDFGRLYSHEPLRSFPTYAVSGYDTANFIAGGGLQGERVHGLLSDICTDPGSGRGAANVSTLMVKFSIAGPEKYVVSKR